MATTLIALIRGINVGPSKRVAMADLRELLTGLGYSDVRTHLQSGNAVFSTGAKPATVGAEIEDALADRVGVRASVVVRTGRQLTAAMAADPVAEIAEKMGVNRSIIFDLEAREPKNTITLKSMSRMAEAMDCKVLYGIVPIEGKTLEDLAEKRLWASLLGVGSEIRDQGSGIRGQGLE